MSACDMKLQHIKYYVPLTRQTTNSWCPFISKVFVSYYSYVKVNSSRSVIKMKTFNFIVVCFIIFQKYLEFSVLCASTQYVRCTHNPNYYNSYDYIREGNLTLICLNDSQEIDFVQNSNSESVKCSNHPYESYTVAKTKISRVNIENCQMSKLSIKYDIFKVYTKLQELNISFIGLEVLEKETFTNAGSLKKLNASYNKIQDIPSLLFLNATNLNEIDFSHNQIKRLDSFALSGVRQLKRVDFSYNEIGNISQLVFGNFLSLTYINLSHNEIIEIEPKTFAVLKEVTILDLSFNNMNKLSNSFFDGMDNLQHLHLDHLSNVTIEIEPSAFMGLDRLTQLQLSQNHIASVKMGVFEGIHNLQDLSLHQTIIDELAKNAFSGIGQVTELDLSGNRQNHLNNSSRITILDKEAFDNLTNLIELNMANNPIGTINIGTFSKLDNLKYLNLSNTNLAEIKLGTFSHTKKLKTLDLSWNHLIIIDFNLFLPRYQQLETLYLNENRLTELEGFTHFLFPSLKVLAITGNNFNCSYLKEFLRKFTLHNITLVVNDYWAPLNPHEMNIHGIKCHEDNENEMLSTVIMIDANTTTTTTTIKYDMHEDVKLKQENRSNLDTKQPTINLTNASSVFPQGQNDLHIIKSLLMYVCLMLSFMFIIILIIIYINRDRILHIPHYRGFSRKSEEQSRACINNDYEVSTFSHENTK